MTLADELTAAIPLPVNVHAAARAAIASRDGSELPAADPYPDMQERLTRYADQKFSG
jgi:hypothetical protein